LLAGAKDKKHYFFFNTQVHTTGSAAARPDLPSESEPRKLAIDKATIDGGAYYLITISDWNAAFTKQETEKRS